MTKLLKTIKTNFQNLINSCFGKNKTKFKKMAKTVKPFDFSKDTKNTVLLRGIIKVCHYNEKATVMRVELMDNHSNFPKVIFFGDAKEIADRYKIYDKVEIKGYVQSEKFNRDEKNQETSYIVGTAIEPLPEDYENCERINYKSNRIALKGKVVDVFEMDKLVKVTVKTLINGYYEFVPVDYYIYGKNELTTLKNGDIIEVNGYVQTSEKMYGDTLKQYQNFVARHVKFAAAEDISAAA